MANPVVQYQLDQNIAVIRIDNPPVNALSQAVRAGVMDALGYAERDQAAAVLLLCSGRTFIAGADITEFGKPPQPPSLPEVIQAIESQPRPVIAALHGNALGGGLEVALAAHYRCALPGTRLGLPEVNLGLLPGAGGTQRLPRLVGVQTALDMMLSGKPVSAERALETGLVDAIIDGEVETAALHFTAELLQQGKSTRPTGQMEIDHVPDTSYFDSEHKRVAARMRGQIAPAYIIDLVAAATRLPIAEGQVLERERFVECRSSPQSTALRHVFFAERATGKVPGITADTRPTPVNSVAVIGAGTMGGGIAMNFAQAGIPVTLVETGREALDRGLALVRKNYQTSVKRGRYSAEQVEAFMERISGTTEYLDIGTVDAVVEAVFENMAVKKEVFAKLDAVCKPDCILATNTSYLDINEIAAATSRPGQVIGAHFFSPANVMRLLEVVRAEQTADNVIVTFMQLAKTIGKIPVLVGVCHGFVGNRMLKGYARQAQLLLLEGATPEQVDTTMQDWGMAMGPLAVGDLAGLDIGYRSRRDQGIAPRSQMETALPDTLVEMDRLGQKSGAGYYRYDPDTRQRQPDPEVEALIAAIAEQWGITRRRIGKQEIIDRLVLALVNEGAAIVDEGIASRPGDVDVVYLNGYGFPRWRGGPMHYADTLGMDQVIARLTTLSEQTGDPCWEPAELLSRLAAQGRQLASLNQGQ